MKRYLRFAAAAVVAASAVGIWIGLFCLGGWKLLLELVFVFYFGWGLLLSTAVCIRWSIDLFRGPKAG